MLLGARGGSLWVAKVSPVISKRTAKFLLSVVEPLRGSGSIAAAEELRKAIAPKRSVKLARVRRVAKKQTRAQSSKKLRELLIKRSGGLCELGEFPHGGCDPHHALGRKGLEEGPHNCLWLCRAHHELVTNPGDEAPGYFRLQATKFDELGYSETARELFSKANWSESKIEAAALSRGGGR